MDKAITGLCMGCMEAMGDPYRVCSNCGYDPGGGYDPSYIKPGTLIASRYVVGSVSHHNGEGARYIGYDQNLTQKVWIREYFPSAIAQRVPAGGIQPLPGYGAQYKALMSDFIDICNEVKRLSITEPVIPIDNVVQGNGTVYAIYRYLDVITLEEWLEQRGGKLPAERAMELFLPLLNTLSNIHGHGAIHRGISPYTVYVDGKGNLCLCDFALGATRTASSELESELFTGYSAPEQYSPSGWQGTWTDVYAIAALFYRTVSGVVPPRSTLVGPGRPVALLEDLVMDIPKGVSAAIADAMNPLTEQRTQAVATLISRLMQGEPSNTAVYDVNRLPNRPSPDRKGRTMPIHVGKRSGGSGKYVMLASALTVAVLLVGIVVFMTGFYPSLMGGENGNNPPDDETSQQGEGTDSAESDTAVPRFVGQRAENVRVERKWEERFAFEFKEEFNEDYGEGYIFDQLPVEGTQMPERGVVILYVSKGPERVELPDLTGASQEAAQKILSDLKVPSEVFLRYDPDVEPGDVINTVPGAGTEVDPARQTVYLFVSSERSESSKEESKQSSQGSRPSAPPPDEETSIWKPYYPAETR